jgi:hypothetical protein
MRSVGTRAWLRRALRDFLVSCAYLSPFAVPNGPGSEDWIASVARSADDTARRPGRNG